MIDYYKIPFVDGGRDKSGCDCWGLVRLYLAELADIELPEYGTISAVSFEDINKAMDNGISWSCWEKKVEPADYQKGDVALMKSVALVEGKTIVLPIHVGVFVSHRDIMHTEPSIGVQVLPSSSRFINRRLVEVRRHEQFA